MDRGNTIDRAPKVRHEMEEFYARPSGLEFHPQTLVTAYGQGYSNRAGGVQVKENRPETIPGRLLF